MVSTNALARAMVVQMFWRGLVAAIGFVLLAAVVSGCANTPVPGLLTPAKQCPGNPCSAVACPRSHTGRSPARCSSIESAYPHRLLSWSWSRGAELLDSAQLTGSQRMKYWELHGEGQESLKKQLGL